MQYDVIGYYENLLNAKNAEINRLQSIINNTPFSMTLQTSCENEIRRLDKELRDLNNDYDELFEANDMLEEKVIRLEMDLDNLMDDYTDLCDCTTYEREQKEKNFQAVIMALDSLEKDLETVEIENAALKDARDGLLTWAADEVELLELEKAANEETIQQLQAEVGSLEYFRGIDDELFDAMRNTWKRQLIRLAKIDALDNDDTLDNLIMDCEEVQYQYPDTAKDIRRVVQAIKKDATK